MTLYPGNIDTGGTSSSASLPDVIDNVSPVSAVVVNRLRNAILAIENELGINPSERFGTVRDRLDCLEFGPCGSGGGGGSLSTIKQDGVEVMTDVEILNIVGAPVTDAGSNQADITFTGFMLLDGSRAATNNWDLGSNRITNLADPIDAQDAVTKAYVDAVLSDGYAPVMETLTVGHFDQRTFTLSHVPELPDAVALFIEGIKQNITVDYTVSGGNIHYIGSEPLLATDTVNVLYYISSSGFGAGGATQTLAETLFYGNVTGGRDLVVSVTDAITSENPATPVAVTGDLSISGKLTVGGLIDPTGFVIDEQATVPGGTPAVGKATIWYRTADGHLVYTNDAGAIIDLTTGITPTLAQVLVAGATTGGTDIELSASGAITSTTGTGVADGMDIDIYSGPATGSGDGGALNLTGGGAASGDGGNVVIYGGNGNNDGDVLLGSAGNTVLSVIGDTLGTVTFDKDVSVIINQTAPTSGAGSNFRIDVQDAVTTGIGGNFIVNAGDGAGASQGGAIDLNAGTTGSGSGGAVTINGGDGTIIGGTITIESGAAATGGFLKLLSGDSAAGTGGDLILTSQGNTPGNIQFYIDAVKAAEFLGTAAGTLRFGSASTPIISVEQAAAGAGTDLEIYAQYGGVAGSNAGGDLLLYGGNGTSGGAGGNIELFAGTGGTTGKIAFHTDTIEIDDGIVDIYSVTDGGADSNSGSFALHSGNIADAGDSGSVTINTGTSVDGNSGNLDLYTGEATNVGNSGAIQLYTSDGYVDSGDIDITTGDASHGSAGHIYLISGDTAIGTANGIQIVSGNVLTGNFGNNINVTGGDGYATGGAISLNAGAGYHNIGGTVNISAGAGNDSVVVGGSSGPGDGGHCNLSGGIAWTGVGGNANLQGGPSTHGTGGNAVVEAGYTIDGTGGNTYISGGVAYGNNNDGVIIFSVAGSEVARFDNRFFELKNVTSTPVAPASGSGRLFLQDGKLKFINSDGDIVTIV